jgi:DNA-binding CsgD family transcriptional regulator
MRESLAIAREHGLADEESSAVLNLADLLNMAGRTEEGLAVVIDGMGSAPKSTHRTTGWFELMIAEFSFFLGDWDEAVRHVPPPNSRHYGPTLAYWYAVRSMIALGRGDLATATQDVDGLSRALRGSTEPQFVAPLGIFASELARRRADFEVARAAVDDALDQIEYCSDDFIRITALSAAGLRVEGDAGQVARDRRDPDAAEAAKDRAERLLERVQLAAALGGPVETAEQATAEAEYARAVGDESAERWSAAATAWEALRRPYPVAYSGWRRAEALAAARDRDGAAEAAAEALEIARSLGSDWLAAELESLVARARLRVDGEEPVLSNGDEPGEPDDPFGLTERERQVLELVAGGATNREIGEQLHMAEKTASVHVSRILGKLDVRSRTEAAAVAHRHGMN